MVGASWWLAGSRNVYKDFGHIPHLTQWRKCLYSSKHLLYHSGKTYTHVGNVIYVVPFIVQPVSRRSFYVIPQSLKHLQTCAQTISTQAHRDTFFICNARPLVQIPNKTRPLSGGSDPVVPCVVTILPWMRTPHTSINTQTIDHTFARLYIIY